MKKLLLSICMAAITGFSYDANAQMAAGNICPNWAGTDLNGNSWDLYTLLDQGKTVFVDVSAAWCGPCWNYHNTGALENLWINHGPAGGTSVSASTTDDLYVFFIEGEAGNTGAQLTGTSGSGALYSQGNWVAGTPYPIIDDAAIANTLQINYFPTIYMICPDRIIREVGQLTTANLYAAKTAGCFAPTVANDAEIRSVALLSPVSATCSTLDIGYRLLNTGSAPLTSADVNLVVNGTVQQTYNWTGSLATYANTTLSFNGVTGVTGLNNAEVTVTNANGGADANLLNNTEDKDFSIISLVGTAPATQNFAGTFPPANWVLYDNGDPGGWIKSTAGFNGAGSAKISFYDIANGQSDAMELPPVDLTGYTNATLEFDLSHARYQTSNDRLKVDVATSCGGALSNIYNKAGATLSTATATTNAFTPTTAAQWRHETASLANYLGNSSVYVRFTGLSNYGNNCYVDNINIVTTTGINDVKESLSYSISNPVTEQATITMSLKSSEVVTFDIINSLGQVVLSEKVNGKSGANTIKLNVSSIASGSYYISASVTDGKIMKPMVKQ